MDSELVFLLKEFPVLVTQLCVTLYDPIGYSLSIP